MSTIIDRDIQSVVDDNENLKCLMNSTIAVTGATGFVGTFFIHTVLRYAISHQEQVLVLAMVRNEERARELFAEYEGTGLIDYIVGDVRETVHYEGAVDYIIHCASNAGPREYGQDPVGTMMTNFLGTDALLRLAKEKQVKRFMYVSTIEIYGATTVDTILEHDFGFMDSTVVRSCYPESKKACETLSISYYEQYQVPVVIGRLSYLYGPGMKKNDSKVIAQFPRLVAEGKNIVMKSKGDQLRSYTYISDAVSAMITILVKGENGEAYNIATPISRITIAGVAKMLVQLRSEKNLSVIFELPDETETKRFSFINNAVLNTNKLEALGFQASVDMKTGLERVLQSIAEEEESV